MEKINTTTYFSPFIYKNGALDRTMVSGGYVKANVPYYFVRDYQGNVRQVVNGSTGAVVQENHYYPYGGLFGESSATALSSSNGVSLSPYKFGGKEQVNLSDNTYLDFCARMYDCQLGRFWTPDPLCWEKPNVSSHSYCKANPVNFVDPSGLDEFELDQEGHMVNVIKKKGDDVFYIVNKEGERINEQGIKGKIIKYKSINAKDDNYEMIEMRGDDASRTLFEFFAQKTTVEWSHILTGEKGDKGHNFIITSHSPKHEGGMTHLWNNQLRFGYHLRTLIHSHPSNNMIPSLDHGDGNVARELEEILSYSIEFKVYAPGLDLYIPYNGNSTYEDIYNYLKALPNLNKEGLNGN